MAIVGGHSVEEIGRLSLWEYGAILYEWAARQPESDEVVAPTAEEYYEDRQALIDRKDPRIRLN